MALSGHSRGQDVSSDQSDRLPPGQRLQTNWPVQHYGPVPKFRPETWDLRVFGATRGGEAAVNWADFQRLPRSTVRGDFHCVTKFTVLDNVWQGVSTAEILRQVEPATGVTHVMVWAEYGYGANLRLADFAAEDAILATHRDGEQLTPEHGFPVRLIVPHLYAWKGPKWVRSIEYLTEDRRGFWEERGYHNIGEAWHGQRFTYQEEPGDGPEM